MTVKNPRILLRISCILTGILLAPALVAWQWPVSGPFVVTGSPDFALEFTFDDPALFRLVAPGEELFVQAGVDGSAGPAGPAGPARTQPRRIYRHANDIWSIVEGTPDSGSVVYRLYDARLDRFVNPRVLLPLDPPGPVETLPDLRYRQDGRIRPASQLLAGDVQIVAPPGGWDSATIPLEISVLQEGQVVANHRFVYAQDIAAVLESDGTLLVASTELRPGTNRIEIQTRRYDGTPRLRRYELRTPDSVPGP